MKHPKNIDWLDHIDLDFVDMSEDEYPPTQRLEFRLYCPPNKIQPFFVIVEMWDHKSYGRGKRLWLETFTPKERGKINRWYRRLYRWYLVTGTPVKGTQMHPTTYVLLQKAANFFATL